MLFEHTDTYSYSSSPTAPGCKSSTDRGNERQEQKKSCVGVDDKGESTLQSKKRKKKKKLIEKTKKKNLNNQEGKIYL